MGISIPKDFPVQPTDGKGPNDATCGTCGMSWDDSIATSMTPAPSGRCPFEAFHNDTWFHNDTPEDVRRALELARECGWRVRIWCGDPDTGVAWPDENDVTGYIGRSTGRLRVPLLIHNRASMGGPHILDHCIVRIDATSGETLYKHPNFSAGNWRISCTGDPRLIAEGYDYEVFYNDTVHARFKTARRASNFVSFMTGKRYAK